jgi:tetratricopeptide (TPR) repeat protein
MKHVIPLLVTAMMAVTLPTVDADDDCRLADGLARRGWTDLAREIYARVADDASLSPDQRADGEYGLVRVKVREAQNAPRAQQGQLAEEAVLQVEAFIDRNPTHPRLAEARSDVGGLYLVKGRTQAWGPKAEAAYRKAAGVYDDLVKRLKAGPGEAREDDIIYGTLGSLEARYHVVEVLSHDPTRRAAMQQEVDQMESLLTDFMWSYDGHPATMAGCTFAGRAFQLLAEHTDGPEAKALWVKCFNHIEKAFGLLDDPATRDDSYVQWIASQSCYFAMKARGSYGDLLQGEPAATQYARALSLADAWIRFLPKETGKLGQAIRLEKARTLCKTGKLDEARPLLDGLRQKYAGTWIEIEANKLFQHSRNPEDVLLAADSLYQQGSLEEALGLYNAARVALRASRDVDLLARSWHGIGRCYYYQGRPYEAVTAISTLDDRRYAAYEKLAEALIFKLQSLKDIAGRTKAAADVAAFEKYQAELVARGFKTRILIASEAWKQEEAEAFAKAAAMWERAVECADPIHFRNDIFRVGLNLYKAGREAIDEALKEKEAGKREAGMVSAMETWKEAEGWFRRHLAETGKLKAPSSRDQDYGAGGILYTCRILTHPRIGRSADALEISEGILDRFPKAPPNILMGVLAGRIDAKIKMGRVEEAEEDLLNLEERYRRDREGHAHYVNALGAVARGYTDLAGAEAEAGRKRALKAKAAGCYYRWHLENPAPAKNPEEILVMAGILQELAEYRREQGLVKEAAEVFDKARDLYGKYRMEMEEKADASTLKAVDLRVIGCLRGAGKVDEAIDALERIVAPDKGITNGTAWELLADCHMERGGEKGVREEERIYGKMATLLRGREEEAHWRLLVKYAEAKMVRSPDDLQRFFTIYDARGVAPEWDRGRFGAREKLEAMRRRLEAVVPGKK